MQAVWYERKGPAREVLQVGERPLPEPGPNEVRVRVHISAVNPSDTKQRGGARANVTMPFPVVIPHQDGAGVIDAVGPGVDAHRIGQRVWIYEATLGRPHGTCAQYTVVPAIKAVHLPDLRGETRFLKLGARAYLVISIAMVAVRIAVERGVIVEAALAVGACSAVARRLPGVEAALVGVPVAEALAVISDAAVAAEISPMDDVRATAEYRAGAAAELLRRAVGELL